MRLTSPARRAAGLLAATTIGLSTAVLSVTGIASAVPTVITSDDDYSASTTDSTPATGIEVLDGYCYGIFNAIGGHGGASGSDLGGVAGEAELWAPVIPGEEYDFQAGTSGGAGSPGAGGTNAAHAAYNGAAGTALTSGGGGGAGSAVVLDGDVIVSGAGGAGGGTGGGAAGGTNYFDADRDFQDRGFAGPSDGSWTGGGYASAVIVGCDAPEAPSITSVSGDGEATVAFFPTQKTDYTAAASGYEYSLNGGTTWTSVTSPTATGGDFGELQFTIPGLTNDQDYSVVMQALSTANGTSETSTAKTFSPHHYIDGPASAKLTAGVNSVTFSWTAPADADEAALVAGYSMDAYPQGYEGDPEAAGAPVMASCDAPVGARSCTVAATPGFAYGGYVSTVDSTDEFGGDADTGLSAKVTSVVVASSLPKSDGTLTTNDADGKVVAGEKITITGKDFLPGSTVDLVVYSTPVKLGSVVVLADGTFSATVTIPADLVNGTHHLVASGVDVNGNPRNLIVEVTVSGGVAALAYTGFTPLPFIGAGVLALLAGGGLLVASRRRA